MKTSVAGAFWSLKNEEDADDDEDDADEEDDDEEDDDEEDDDEEDELEPKFESTPAARATALEAALRLSVADSSTHDTHIGHGRHRKEHSHRGACV